MTKNHENINNKNYIKSDFIKSLIIFNIEKPFLFHMNNLKNNKIILTQNQVKWALQKYRQEIYPSNEKYLTNIANIKITLEENTSLKDIPFCYTYNNLINPEKNNCLEKYAIYTSKFQINMITKVTQIFIDGTFKIAPYGYYQVINIGGYLPQLNKIFPLFFIPTTGKSEFLYEIIFANIKKILPDIKSILIK